MEWVRAIRTWLPHSLGGVDDAEQRPLLHRRKSAEEVEIDKATQCGKVLNYALMLGVVGGGVLLLCAAEKWSLLTSVYVLAQLVTTIGYGDFTVQDEGAQLFMAFYAVFVIVVLAYFLNVVMSGLFERQQEILRRHLRGLQHGKPLIGDSIADYVLRRQHGAINKVIANGFLFVVAILLGTFFFRFAEHCTCHGGPRRDESHCDGTTFETCAATGGVVKGYAESFYMSAITLTTVGFGDYQPRTIHGRVIGIIWMLCGVTTTAMFLSALTEFIFEYEQEEHLNAQEFMVHLQRRHFNKIDRDKNGHLSRAEFLAYTLRKYGGVSKELVEEIWNQYDHLDPEGKGITLEMLRARSASMKESRRRYLHSTSLQFT